MRKALIPLLILAFNHQCFSQLSYSVDTIRFKNVTSHYNYSHSESLTITNNSKTDTMEIRVGDYHNHFVFKSDSAGNTDNAYSLYDGGKLIIPPGKTGTYHFFLNKKSVQKSLDREYSYLNLSINNKSYKHLPVNQKIPYILQLMPDVDWTQTSIDMGAINQGNIAEAKFYFNNTSDDELLWKIDNQSFTSSQYHLSIDTIIYPEHIKPHQQGFITLRIRTEGRCDTLKGELNVVDGTGFDFSRQLQFKLVVVNLKNSAQFNFKTTSIQLPDSITPVVSPSFEYKFTNTGDIPLTITDCGTIYYGKNLNISWPHEPIMPGKDGSINVICNTVKPGEFYEFVYINSNECALPKTELKLSGKCYDQLSLSMDADSLYFKRIDNHYDYSKPRKLTVENHSKKDTFRVGISENSFRNKDLLTFSMYSDKNKSIGYGIRWPEKILAPGGKVVFEVYLDENKVHALTESFDDHLVFFYSENQYRAEKNIPYSVEIEPDVKWDKTSVNAGPVKQGDTAVIKYFFCNNSAHEFDWQVDYWTKQKNTLYYFAKPRKRDSIVIKIPTADLCGTIYGGAVITETRNLDFNYHLKYTFNIIDEVRYTQMEFEQETISHDSLMQNKPSTFDCKFSDVLFI